VARSDRAGSVSSQSSDLEDCAPQLLLKPSQSAKPNVSYVTLIAKVRICAVLCFGGEVCGDQRGGCFNQGSHSSITQALLAAPDRKCTLREIYEHIKQEFPYFQTCDTEWKNCVRHNLSLNKCFVRLLDEGTNSRQVKVRATHPWCIMPAPVTYSENKTRIG
jgi:hypothetical protein